MATIAILTADTAWAAQHGIRGPDGQPLLNRDGRVLVHVEEVERATFAGHEWLRAWLAGPLPNDHMGQRQVMSLASWDGMST